MGVVYLAEHDRIERSKAVKVLRGEWASDPLLVRRFFDEALAAAACRHDHVIAVDDCGTLLHGGRGHHYIVMELLEGTSLADTLAKEDALDVVRAVRIVAYAADAVAAAHARGVVHRDLKPANLFLARRGARSEYVKVLDFGIARLDAHADGAPSLLGTPDYMAPEQLRGAIADERSDIYSLGAILFRLIAGRLPTERPLSLDERRALPRGVRRALVRSLASDPESRFATMHDFLRALLADDAVPEALAPEASLDVPLETRPAPPPGSSQLTPTLLAFTLGAAVLSVAAITALSLLR